MGKINWGRVFGCGLVTGGLYLLLATAIDLLALHETEFVQATMPHGVLAGGLASALDLVVGIWTMWLYAAIRPRYGPGPKTAAVAGLAAWVAFFAVIQTQLTILGLMTLSLGTLVVPLAVRLPLIIVAAVVGAWQYKE